MSNNFIYGTIWQCIHNTRISGGYDVRVVNCVWGVIYRELIRWLFTHKHKVVLPGLKDNKRMIYALLYYFYRCFLKYLFYLLTWYWDRCFYIFRKLSISMWLLNFHHDILWIFKISYCDGWCQTLLSRMLQYYFSFTLWHMIPDFSSGDPFQSYVFIL
jgi:hypothetical protein